MIKYKYKEKTYAEEILRNGFTSNFVAYELKILIKYYKEQGFKPKEREELIYKFCEKYLEGYNRVLHFRMINSVLNYGKKKEAKLIQIDSVSVSNEELKFIDNLNYSQDHKKLLFTLLVLDKLNKNEYEIKNEKSPNVEHYFGGKDAYYKDLKKRANVPTYRRKSEKNVNELIYDLNKSGLIEIGTKAIIKLVYLYNMLEDDSVVMEVSHFDDIGYYYDLHVGMDKMKKCECCGKPIKVKIATQKYCNTCAKDKERNRKKHWKRNRSNISSEKLEG